MEQINDLADAKIFENLQVLATKENGITCEILLYLIEADNRKLYLEKGYSSLFDYCTRDLGYSEPAAMRRITAARCSRKYPQVYELLNERKVTLSTVSLFAGILTRDNVSEVLKALCGKSKREVEVFISTFRPVKKVVQSIKPVSLAVPQQEASSLTFPGECDNPVRVPGTSTTTGLETRYRINFSVPEQVMKKLKVAQALSSKGYQLSELFEALLDNFIESRTPKRICAPRSPATRTRYLSKTTRKAVFQRDNHRCAYVAPDGTRCTAQVALQIDHVLPFAKGGGREAQNLRCLCPQHNRFMAEKEFGREFMKRFG